jgi:uncharacterized membrane protein
MENDRLTSCIARQEWLEPLAEDLAGAVKNAIRSGGESGKKVADFLHGTWLGHPLHPALTDVPVGAWTVTLMLDTAGALTGDRTLERAADAALTLGIIGAVGSAVTGITDWHTTSGAARRIGLMHAMLNSTALVLYSTSLGLRRRRQRESGRMLAYLGYAISTTAAYIGGHLVFRDAVGVHAGANPKG